MTLTSWPRNKTSKKLSVKGLRFILITDLRQLQASSKSNHQIPSPSSTMAQSAKPISSPVPESLYPTLAFFMLTFGLIVTASFFIYEATSSRKSRSLAREFITGAIASVFLGFGSLFLLLSTGVYV